MNTEAGYNFFSNQLVNQQLKKVLNYWATTFLNTEKSTYVFTQSSSSGVTGYPYVGWLTPDAQVELLNIVNSATGAVNKPTSFEDVFVSDPAKPNYGFGSWDEFFVREFREGVRPVEEPDNASIIVNACESAPLRVQTDVKLSDKFWLKGQPYSLLDMLNYHELSGKFVGGTGYQAFLSALSYHRWHSPVDGKVLDVYLVDGAYFLQNQYMGFGYPGGPDSITQELSQPFLSAVAARGVIFIECDNPAIGTVAIVTIGMVEVSSNEFTVKPGDVVKKGDEIGMFHFGGSTHVVLFEKGVKLDWIDRIKETDGKNFGQLDQTNIALSSKIATVIE